MESPRRPPLPLACALSLIACVVQPSCVASRTPSSKGTASSVSRRDPDEGAVVLHRASTGSGLCGDSSFVRLELAEAFSWCSRVNEDSNLHFWCRAGHDKAELVLSIRPGSRSQGGYTVHMQSSGPCWEPPGLGLATVSDCGRTLIKRAQSLACASASAGSHRGADRAGPPRS